MAVSASCANCDTPIVDPTSQVVHGGQIYCCANCSAAMEQGGSGSDRGARGHAGNFQCAHCGTAIIEELTMTSRGDDAFCCANCAAAIGTKGG